MDLPVVELPPGAFPVLIEFFATPTGERVWEATVERPDSGWGMLRVPPLARVHGSVRVRITYGDGEVFEAEAVAQQGE